MEAKEGSELAALTAAAKQVVTALAALLTAYEKAEATVNGAPCVESYPFKLSLDEQLHAAIAYHDAIVSEAA